jgi:hypothetical protein
MGLFYLYELLPLEIQKPEANYSPNLFFGGGGDVSRGSISKFSKAEKGHSVRYVE